MILDLCLAWGRDESWFYSKPSDEQTRLLGWWRARQPRQPSKPSPRRPGQSRAAQALAQQVADRRNRVNATQSAESFWFSKD